MKRFVHVSWRVMRLLIFCVLSLLVALALFFTSLYMTIVSSQDGNAVLPADCALVFGAAVYGQGVPSPAISRRIDAATALFAENQVQRLIVSGGKGSGVRESEAQVMADLAVTFGVPRDRILLEDASHSTWENLQNSQNLTADCSSVLGISDGYHLARIRLIAWRQGWDKFTTAPTRVMPDDVQWQRAILRELFAYTYYLFYGDFFLQLNDEE